jgi:hypothetical protein
MAPTSLPLSTHSTFTKGDMNTIPYNSFSSRSRPIFAKTITGEEFVTTGILEY